MKRRSREAIASGKTRHMGMPSNQSPKRERGVCPRVEGGGGHRYEKPSLALRALIVVDRIAGVLRTVGSANALQPVVVCAGLSKTRRLRSGPLTIALRRRSHTFPAHRDSGLWFLLGGSWRSPLAVPPRLADPRPTVRGDLEHDRRGVGVMNATGRRIQGSAARSAKADAEATLPGGEYVVKRWVSGCLERPAAAPPAPLTPRSRSLGFAR